MTRTDEIRKLLKSKTLNLKNKYLNLNGLFKMRISTILIILFIFLFIYSGYYYRFSSLLFINNRITTNETIMVHFYLRLSP